MKAGHIITTSGLIRYIAMLALGLVLGTAAPTLADTASDSAAIACNTVGAEAAGESEWAMPPIPGLPGEPY